MATPWLSTVPLNVTAMIAKGLVILIGFTLAAGLTSLPRTDFWKQAVLSGSLQAMALRALPLVPGDVAKYVRFE